MRSLIVILLSIVCSPALASAVDVLIDDFTEGYYNESIGRTLDAEDDFPMGWRVRQATDFPEPNLSLAADILGNWLDDPSNLNANWSDLRPIPRKWDVFTETAIIYPLDLDVPIRNVELRMRVDNGAFVWLDGEYITGWNLLAVQTMPLPDLDTGKHYLQILRGDWGVVTGYTISLTAERGIIYVDDDALNDPEPYDLTVSDPDEDGTRAHPYDSVQQAIDEASDGCTIVVLPGGYVETIDFLGKSLEITSAEPDRPDDLTFPIIDGDAQGPVVTFASGEQRDCILRGFVLIGGAGSIDCIDSSPSIRNCVITGNRSSGLNRGVIHCVDSRTVFDNCTIADNYDGDNNGTFYLVRSDPNLSNCIVWNNLPSDFVADVESCPLVRFSDTTIGWAGEGNIEAEPFFALPGYWADPADLARALDPAEPAAVWIPGDYHLMSFTGRWDPTGEEWVSDEATSPCIDMGNPEMPWAMEALPNGGRINMGAYGGTSQASKTGFLCVLSVQSSDGGSIVRPGEGDFAYECGSVVNVEAVPDECCEFIGWTGTAVEAGKVDDPTAADIVVTMDGDYTLRANFSLIRHVLTVASSEGGTVTKPGEGVFEYDCGTYVLIEAIADEHADFAGWSGTAVENGKVDDPTLATTTVTMDGDYTLQANFKIHQHTVTISSTTGGYAYLTAEQGGTSRSWASGQTIQLDHGTKVFVTATALPGYEFTNFSGTIWSGVDYVEFTVNHDYVLTANFVEVAEP